MTQPDELARRFNEIMRRLESIHAQLGLPRDEGVFMVEIAELDRLCRQYREKVDQLLELAASPEIDDVLGKRLIAISVEINDLAMCGEGLKGPA